jgi:hypothetical protein
MPIRRAPLTFGRGKPKKPMQARSRTLQFTESMTVCKEFQMVTAKERARLMQPYKDEPIYAAGALIKSAICLLMIAGIAVIGATTDRGYNDAQLQTHVTRDRS